MRIFGIDPGSERTGYGCVETDGSRHRSCRLRCARRTGHTFLSGTAPRRFTPAWWRCSTSTVPDCVAIENIFHAKNVRSALKLGHARGVALLAASSAGAADRRVHACGDQARGRRVRAGREAAGRADGEDPARARGGALAARRGRCRGDRHLSHSHQPRRGRRTRIQRTAASAPRNATAASLRSWRRLPSVIARLTGTILEKHPNRVVVDVGGVGYDVLVPLSTFYGLGEAGVAITLRIHTHVREDAHRALWLRHGARAGSVRAADLDQRHRSEARAGRPVGNRPGRVDPRDRYAGRRAADAYSGCREENRRTDRPRAERSPPAPPACRRAGDACWWRYRGTTCSRRW